MNAGELMKPQRNTTALTGHDLAETQRILDLIDRRGAMTSTELTKLVKLLRRFVAHHTAEQLRLFG